MINRFGLWIVAATFGMPLCCEAADERPAAAASLENRQQAERIEQLVRQLGAKTFTVRQRAQRQLIDVGLPAKAALQIACESPDAEIRQRAKQTLVQILDVDFQVRLESFLTDESSDDGHGLPGWQRYRVLAGNGPLARRLFGEMLRAERELLEAAEDNAKQAGDVLEARCVQIGQSLSEVGSRLNRSPQVPPATLAALLLAAANDQVPISLPAGTNLYQFCRERTLEQAMLAQNTGDVLRRLLVAWVSRRLSSDSAIAYWNMALGMENDIKESLSPASDLVTAGAAPAHWIQYAILAVGKFGGVEQLPLLEPLLNDARSIAVPNRGRQELDAQVRDVALAVLVHLSGQKLADYGFTQVRTHPSCLFIADSLGFNDPAARDRALQKWRENRGQGTGDRE